MLTKVLIIITILVQSCLAYNVLGIFPTPAKSHYLGAKVLLHGLAADGHNVTVIGPFPPTEIITNFENYTIAGIDEAMSGKNNFKMSTKIVNK